MKKVLIMFLVGLVSLLIASIMPDSAFNWDWFLGWSALSIAQGINEII